MQLEIYIYNFLSCSICLSNGATIISVQNSALLVDSFANNLIPFFLSSLSPHKTHVDVVMSRYIFFLYRLFEMSLIFFGQTEILKRTILVWIIDPIARLVNARLSFRAIERQPRVLYLLYFR